MSRELLFEIGTEELPWGAIEAGRVQLAERAEKFFPASGLHFSGMEIYSTPRRLTLYIAELPEKQEDTEIWVTGPPAAVAFEADGSPTKAAIGFARGQGVDVSSLRIVEKPKGKFVEVYIREEGLPTIDLLPDLLAELARSLNFRKSMRWGSGEFRFARPVRWLLALYGTQVVPVELDGLVADSTTRGHRLYSSKKLIIREPNRYIEVLHGANVIAREEERRQVIVAGIADLTAARGLTAMAEQAIIDEVTDLTEDPHVIMGSFPEHYLELPREVLVTAMEEHQRYIPVESASGELAPSFIVVHNGHPAAEANIRAGNERVLRARLDDALFFYRDDTREPLEAKVEKLKHVVFQADLGTLYDKALRLARLSRLISERAGLAPEVAERAERAALLCKADLVTDMVIEFTSLQGVMGRIYALAAGEPPAVAEAISEHYLPRFSGDDLPAGPTGQVLSLAEKFDNLAGSFGAGLIPSGSEDPYALRRQCGAIFNIIWKAGLRLDINELTAAALAGYVEVNGLEFAAGVQTELADFFASRLRLAWGSEGFRYDLVAAALPYGPADPVDARARLEALEAAAGDGRLGRVYTAFERCYNLSKGMEEGLPDPGRFTEGAEHRLWAELGRIREPLQARLRSEDYAGSFDLLLELAPAVDQLFDAVFIMADDLEVRENRLRLLKECSSPFMQLADFREIVPQGQDQL